MTGSFVFVIHAFVGNAVHHFNRIAVNGLRSSFVAGFNSFQYFLNRGAESGTQACVVGAVFHSLAGTFAGLCAIGHIGYLLIRIKFRKRAILMASPTQCKLFSDKSLSELVKHA